MIDKEFLAHIKTSIRAGDIKHALDKLENILKDSKFSTELSLLQSRFSSLNEKKRKGIITESDSSLEYNKIVNSFLEIIESIKQDHSSIWQLRKYFYLPRIGKIFLYSISIIALVLIFSLFAFLITFMPAPNFQDTYTLKTKPLNSHIETLTYDRIHFIGKDNKGNTGEYFLYITKDFNWKKGKDAVSERRGKEKDICLHFIEHEMISRINSDKIIGLFALGNASHEENTSITDVSLRLKEEENRAAYRARKLASCIGDNLSRLTPVFTINLGKHKETDTNSNYQRLIVVIGILNTKGPILHAEALYQGLVDEYTIGNIEFDIRNYSRVINKKLEVKRVLN